MNGEKAKNRTYLSPQRAMLLHIVEENYKIRPICFSNLCNPFFYGGLDQYFKNCGLVSILTPIQIHNNAINYSAIKALFTASNFKHYADINKHNIPQISGLTLMYHQALYLLAEEYAAKNEIKQLKQLVTFYKSYLCIDHHIEAEKYFIKKLELLNDEE